MMNKLWLLFWCLWCAQCWADDTVSTTTCSTVATVPSTTAAAPTAAPAPPVEPPPAPAPAPAPPTDPKDIPCTCGVFLSGQFVKGSDAQPRGNAALLHEQTVPFPCTPMGLKQCINRCLDTIVKHLPNSPSIICGSIDRDCYKERAYLFVKNCSDKWVNTNLSAGREYCCKDGVPYKCPIMS